jgi:hypothetical protein
MKRRPELSVAEFREYWNSQEFTDLLDKMTSILEPVSVKRNLTLNVEINAMLMEERGSEEPYDGILEVWIESAADLQKLQNSEEGDQVLKDMETYQKQFVDFTTSKRFFTE